MPSAKLGGRRREVLPKELAEQLSVSKTDLVASVVKRGSAHRETLKRVMDWDPERTGKPEKIPSRTMKRIWQT